MNRQEVKDETRYITKTNTSTYTDADIESGLELIRKRIIMKAIRASTEWNLRGEIAQTDLVSITGLLSGENGYNGEYAFPSDLIKFTRIDLSYNGVTYNRATQYFMNDSDDSEETEKERNSVADIANPVVKIYRDSFFIRPLPTTTVVSGIKLKYQKNLAELTDDTTDIEELPEFQEIYAYSLAIRFGTRYPRKMKAEWRRKYSEIEEEMMKFYTNRFTRNLQLKTINEDYS